MHDQSPSDGARSLSPTHAPPTVTAIRHRAWAALQKSTNTRGGSGDSINRLRQQDRGQIQRRIEYADVP
jgi:hypothetical protein